jgi:ATP-binding cassette subfamily B protein
VTASALVAGVMPGMSLLLNAGVVCALWFGGVAVTQRGLHIGQLLAFINYLLQMLSSLMMVGMMIMRVTRAEASAERILDVLESTPDIQDAPHADDLPVIHGRVRFDAVSFSYDGAGGNPVLSDISFSVAPGQTMVILGATGAGKSTLVHLLPRLYDVTAGRILIDDIDVRAVTQQTLRRDIAIVMQETVLFSGTIRENLRYGRPEATDAEIEEAAQLAQAAGKRHLQLEPQQVPQQPPLLAAVVLLHSLSG